MARRKRDYYAVLGIEKSATEGDIKRAFRELARQHHPDVNPAGAERFRELNEAYSVLSDKDQRARYDRWGHSDDSGGGLGAVVDAAQDVINDLFRRRRAKQKGRDVRYTLEVTFEEAAFGATKPITIPPSGALKERQINVVVPASTKDGFVKTLGGEGEPSAAGGAAGDLHITVRVAEHTTFTRDAFDVRSKHTVTFAQAALGAVIDFETLDGPVKMRVPEGTQPGRVFRIRGRGIPHAASKQAPRGDHLVEVDVAVPTELTPEQRAAIEALAVAMGERVGDPQLPAPKKGLLDRVRSLLDE
jgi:DnaJ-class molecular chaperone